MLFRSRLWAVAALLGASLLLALPTAPLPHEWSLAATAYWASTICGYAGAMLLAWLLLLGSRPASRLLTTDYAQGIELHRQLGTWGTILIFAHPLLVMVGYSEDLAFLVVPDLSTATARAITLGRVALWLLLLVWFSSAVLRSRMTRRPWKYLHFTAYLALFFLVFHIPLAGFNFADRPYTAVYYWTLLALLLVAVVARLGGALGLGKHRFTITSNTELSPGVHELQLRRLGPRPFTPTPGQFVYLQLRPGGEEHPFSIVAWDAEEALLTVSYRVLGPFTRKLANQSTGTVRVTGPLGSFTHQIDGDRTVYVAGGIGITPFVTRLLTENATREQWLVYCVRSPQHATYAPQLQAALKERYLPLYSEQAPEGVATELPTAQRIMELIPAAPANRYFLCGPPAMTQSLTRGLRAAGVASNRIHTEEFSL
ncbi:hypothetical protein EII12_03080 [Buchananella hordeovulneris]|uniref:ferric reductase-like transmembrane domain-containing protein n=1 Tax=Buchananella hordeovulneris TaxID=52770 RepID=UPI000F5DFC37|nr:ferric reductase-like transmembrane domain-containing protein [Buchananella hordeovulneris]RRD53089.1 hypothetical protein EII12_03080 [Buchananella hordeovulneris]